MVQPGRRMHLAFWIPKATNTHSKDLIVISFPRHNGSSNAPQCHVCNFIAYLVIRYVHVARKLTCSCYIVYFTSVARRFPKLICFNW
jgi:hypothetical protein